MSFDGGVPTSCVETDGKCLQKETQVQLCNACLNRTCFLLLFGAWLGILHSSVVQLNELPVNERQKQSSLRETSSSALSSCFSARTGSADVAQGIWALDGPAAVAAGVDSSPSAPSTPFVPRCPPLPPAPSAAFALLYFEGT